MVKGPYFGRHYLVKQKVRFRDHIFDLLHGQKGTELFQIFRIHLVKLAQLVAVDIQYGNHFPSLITGTTFPTARRSYRRYAPETAPHPVR